MKGSDKEIPKKFLEEKVKLQGEVDFAQVELAKIKLTKADFCQQKDYYYKICSKVEEECNAKKIRLDSLSMPIKKFK